jgi:HEAT repeat protein
MSATFAVLLSLAVLAPQANDPPNLKPTADLARLRELLQDRQEPRVQNQAALLLLQDHSEQAESLVRQVLAQVDAPETFLALCAAIRLARDPRFSNELFAALQSTAPAIRQAAADALAEAGDETTIGKLQQMLGDAKLDRAVRQSAIWTLGNSGRKSAAGILIEQLANNDEAIRQSAVDGLFQLTGQTFGADLERWRAWWSARRDQDNEHWLLERLAYQRSHCRRLVGDLDRARAQVVRLHQQLYARLAAGDRLGHVQDLGNAEDPAVRQLAVTWSLELLPTADSVGQHALADLLLRLSGDADAEVQRAAALALGNVVDRRAFDRLRSLIQEGSAATRAAAARALAQQVRGTKPDSLARQHEVIPVLQKALDDSSLEVVIEAAEGLGSLGVPEAGPVLTILLRHPSQPVRQTAALALERVAELNSLDELLESLNDTAVAVRFSLVGALAHAAGDGHALSEAQRARLNLRLEEILLRDADHGVRGRAATVLGECGSALVLPTLWSRVMASEDARVQEKAWTALVDILCRSANLDLLREWDRRLVETQQPARRLQLLTEVYSRWLKKDESKNLAGSLVESLIATQLDQGKWAAAFPLVHELLARPSDELELEKRLRWLLSIGEQAIKEGNKAETLRIVQEAQAFLSRRPRIASEFDRLEKLAKP